MRVIGTSYMKRHETDLIKMICIRRKLIQILSKLKKIQYKTFHRLLCKESYLSSHFLSGFIFIFLLNTREWFNAPVVRETHVT